MHYKNRKLRHELKYLIPPGTYEILRRRLRDVLSPDKNAGEDGAYRVTSLYLDDIYRSSYLTKIGGEAVRRKYRVRAYDLSPARITLEAKHKDDNYISKRHATLTLEEYRRLLAGDYAFGAGERFAGTAMEDLLVSETITRPRPAVLVDYFREAYVGHAGNVRITFDKRLATSHSTLDMFEPGAVFSPVLAEEIIMEIKYDEFLPAGAQAVFSGVPLLQESISKYILCMDKRMEVNKQCWL